MNRKKIVQLTKSGPVITGSRGDLERLVTRFRDHDYVRLPQLIERSLLQLITQRIAVEQFKPKVHPNIKRELYLENSGTVGLLNFLVNNRKFFEMIEQVTGCERIGCFIGRVYRMDAQQGHRDSWHDDLGSSRMVAMSVNLGPTPHSGAILEIQSNVEHRVVHKLHNTGFGDALLFRLADHLKHRVTEVRGSVPKLAYAGWFQAEPDLFAEIKRRRFSADCNN